MQNSLVGDQINNPGLLGPVALTVSADGKSVFVASTVSSAIAVIARQTTAPLLSLAQTLQNGVNGVRALAAPNGLAVSADGRFLFAGVQTDNMAVFEFGNNRWQFVQQVRNNNNNVTGLFAPNAVVIGADASGQSTAYVATLGNPSASELGGIVSFGIATGQPQPHSTAVIFDIPRSRHDPKILWVDDAEIVGDRITKVRPIPRNLFTQKTERRIGELGTSCVALVVSDVSVHEAP